MQWEILAVVLVLYISATAYLGVKAYKGTKTGTDYLLGGRKIHPLVLALTYGATFISTSALVGFGGFAAMWGLNLFWLVFFNILVGIFVAFVFYGKKTRQIGYKLQAHTFPELFARRFNSKFMQIFGGLFIFILMPLYASAVLLGGARLLEGLIGLDFKIAIFIYAIIVTAYVLFGGIKGVVYNDALQGGIMIFGLLFLIIYTLNLVGGFDAGLEALSKIEPKGKLLACGHQGWTKMPVFTTDMPKGVFWWVIISSITLGVGIGVLVQPQLVVRFMMVKSKRELHRSLILGSVFILLMTGGAFFVGALCNVYFVNKFGNIALAHPEIKGVVGKIIPFYIKDAMPPWFSYVFILTILAAAMSTLSSQFHAIGTSIGRDFYQKGLGKGNDNDTIKITRLGIVISLVSTVLLSYMLKGENDIIARATSCFFGLCSATFLPSYTAMLYWKRVTRIGVIASWLTGTLISLPLFFFVNGKMSAAFKLMNFLKEKGVISQEFIDSRGIWTVVDPLLIALPASLIVLIVVSLMTKDDCPEITKALFEEKA